MNRGYTLVWRKAWANPLLCGAGKKFTRLEAWLHLTNVLTTGTDDPDAGLRRGEFRISVRRLAGLWNWSPAAASRPDPYHLFWDDIDKLKATDFKTDPCGISSTASACTPM